MPLPIMPRFEVYVHADTASMPVDWLRTKIEEALPLCLEECGPGEADICEVEEIEINLVSDETIGAVHAEFMNDPDPTDVITFRHGEIFVSLDTARKEGPIHGYEFPEEVLLYVIHGLLHLNGYTDLSEPERTEMHTRQESILRHVLADKD